MNDVLIDVKNLKKYFPTGTKGQYVKAVDDVTFQIKRGETLGVVGESGCGKSTVASVLTGRCRGYTGSAALGGGEISALSADSLLRTVTYVGFSSYLFRGSVAENLRMARPDADDASLWDVLERVRLADFLRGERGLDTPLDAQGANLSGGQRQRLALARALLHDSPVYVSTKPHPTLTWRAKTTSWLRSARWPGAGRSSSSRTALPT